MNIIYPEETEEIGKSIVVLHTENRRLLSLIQRLTKDSEEHAKNWFHDYNVRNQYLKSDSTESNPGANSSGGRNELHPRHGPRHQQGGGQNHQAPLQRPASSIGGLNYATSFAGTTGNHLESKCSMKSNASHLQNTGNHHGNINYNLQLAGVNLSPSNAQGHQMGDEETSLIHRYNGQSRSNRLFVDEAEEIIVETDMSSCDSPVRQIFCQSGSSLDDADTDEIRLISPSSERNRERDLARDRALQPNSVQQKTTSVHHHHRSLSNAESGDEIIKDETRV